jgi:MFS transporter, FSR family, fosmidomycin resistance protein
MRGPVRDERSIATSDDDGRGAGERAGTSAAASERRVLAVACGAHVLHDGFTDSLYLLLPLWKAEFGLGFAAVGIVKALYSATMAGFQTPSSMIATRLGRRTVLALGTAVASAGWLVGGATGSLAALLCGLFLGGLGASAQHPIAAALVAGAFQGSRSRGKLATYNFAGDVGKVALPALTTGLLLVVPWRVAMLVLGAIGLVTARAVLLLPREPPPATHPPTGREPRPAAPPAGARGFRALLLIGALDSATRMGFLTFLPFLLTSKGATLPVVGAALTATFAGGAAGKLVCGFLGARLGVVPTVFLTEGLTAAGIVAIVLLPLPATFALLPVIGLALNGTSSVLYGTVPELSPPDRRDQAFGVFYTATIGAGALAPIAYGTASDLASVPLVMCAIAAVVLLTLPLAWSLRPALAHDASLRS